MSVARFSITSFLMIFTRIYHIIHTYSIETGRFSDAVSTIYGMINCMDQGVGQILDALSAAGITEDTFVVFTSDNGPDLHGDWKNATYTTNSLKYTKSLKKITSDYSMKRKLKEG